MKIVPTHWYGRSDRSHVTFLTCSLWLVGGQAMSHEEELTVIGQVGRLKLA
jgi:hypothetical protein